MNVPVVSHLKLLVNLYNKMNNRFLVLLVIYLIIYLLSVLYKNKQIFCAILLSLLSRERGLKSYGSWVIKGKCLRGLRPRSTTDILYFLICQYRLCSLWVFPLGGSFAILRQSSACLVYPLCFSMLRLGVQYHE